MAKMTAIYKVPKDSAAFDQHYFNVHIPLARELPGLVKYEISDGAVLSTTGHAEPYRIANLYFHTMVDMKTAFQSEIGQQCAADRKILANNEEVQIYLYDTKDA